MEADTFRYVDYNTQLQLLSSGVYAVQAFSVTYEPHLLKVFISKGDDQK